MADQEINIMDTVKTAWDAAEKKMGRTNILIVGKTGVGKSTLINSVFHDNLATTGQGKRVTDDIDEKFKDGIPVSIFDTRGLEVKEYKETLKQIKEFVHNKKTSETDENKQIHAAWVCIMEDSRRVEDAEIELVKMLSEEDIPVIGVITKARVDDGFQAKVKELLPQVRNVIRVRALEEKFDEGNILPQMNLDKLVELTNEVLPEGRRNAFIAAQKVSIQQKIERSQGIIAASAAAAAAACAVPIPFADSAMLVPIEIGMLAGISKVFGLKLSKGFLGTLVASMLGTSAATVAGKTIFTNIMKCIPGAGSVIGGAVSAATSSALSTTLGELYVGSLTAVFNATKGEPPKEDDIEKEFKARLENKK